VSLSQLIPAGFVGLTAAVQAALVYFLAKRNKRSNFPIFFVFNILAVIAAVALFSAHAAAISVPEYFYLFWALNALLMLVEFGVMYEIFVQALKPYDGLIDLGKMLFKWAGVFLLLAAGLTAFSTADSNSAKCIAAVNLLERGVLLMQCGLLLLFFIFQRRLGLSWRSHTVCIALGLGISATLELGFSYLRTHFAAWGATLDLVDLAQYLAVVSFWSVCFFIREPQRKNVLDSPAKLIFQRWNEALITSPFSAGRLAMGTGGMNSFLPNVEQTVERVMARKMIN
jgi:hypothetical protein